MTFLSNQAFSQTTINFNGLGYADNHQFGKSTNISGFTFAINTVDAPDDITYDDGSHSNSGSAALYDDNLNIGGITQWTIKKTDLSEFQLISIYIKDAGVGSTSGTISAYKNGALVAGSSVAINFDGLKTLSGNSKYNDIDEIRINATDINFYLDDFTYGTPIVPCAAPTAQATSAVFGTETTSSLTLNSYTAPAGGATGYAVYINSSNSFTAPSNGTEPTADTSWNGSGQQAIYFGTSASPTVTVTGLSSGTTYYYKIYAYNDCSGTETYETTGLSANDITTAIVAPTVTTNAASGITTVGVTLGGYINPSGGDGGSPITERGFVYSKTSDDSDPAIGDTNVTKKATSGTTGAYGQGVNGLTAGTGYSYKAYATNAIGTSYGSVQTFTTNAITATVSSVSITFITTTSAILTGNVTADGGASVTERGVVYALSATNANPLIGGTGVTKDTSGTGTGSFSKSITSLAPGTSYSFKAYAINSAGTSYGATRVFVTSSTIATVTTTAASSIATTSATLAGNVTADGGAAGGGAVTERGIVYSITATNANPLINGTGVTKDTNGTGTGVYSESITSLTPGTQYSFKAYAINNVGTSYGSVQAFTTTSLIALTITGLTGDDKVYNGTTTASATGTAALSGVVGADDVTLGGSPVFTFASANVGTGITMTTTGYTLSGTDAGKYSLTQPTLSADITVKSLTITGLTGDDKTYNGTTSASATGTATLSGVVGADDVTLGGSPVFTFASANVGTGITVTTTGYTTSGTDSGNYSLTQPTLSADITAKSLTITGLTGDDKVYNGTTSATATGTATLSGIIGADDVTLGGSPVFTFASANVGTGITVTTTGYTISGTDSGNYSLTQPTLSADITGVTLTITGLTGDDKVYNGTTSATATGTAALSGIIGADDVTLSGSPVFTLASANVGTGITVTTTGYTLSGTDAGKYSLTQPTLSADITVKSVTITGLTGDDKAYNGTTSTTATGTATLSGLVGADDVTLGGSPVFTFASANVGTGITVTTTGYTISGTDSGNYSLTQPTLSADITAKSVTITGLTGDDKTYNGTTSTTATGTATLSGVIGADDVTLGGGSPVFTFASANVGTGITVTTTGYTISGTDSGNYSLTQPTLSADITAATLTITGITGDDKVYNGTTTASASGTATLSGVIGADVVTLGGSPVFTFASANVGTGITVTTTGYTISGTDSGNYSLTQPTLSADITAKSLTITGLTGDDKVYNGTTTASASGTATLSGIIGADDVTLGGSPVFTFASANVGTGITVTTTGYTISGTDSGNYSLTQPTLSADITGTPPTITFIDINKTYGDAGFNLGATSNSAGTISYSIIGAANGTSLSGTNNATVSLGNNSSVTIRATQAANGIYSSETKDITLTINKKAITVTADAGQKKVSGASDPVFTYQITSGSLVGSDAFSGVLSRAAGETVGPYAIQIGSLTLGTNYNITLIPTNFNIDLVITIGTVDRSTKSVTVSGQVSSGTGVIERGVVYSASDTTPELGEPGVKKVIDDTTTGPFIVEITDLHPSTTYYFQSYIILGAGKSTTATTFYGGIETFTTLVTEPLLVSRIPANTTLDVSLTSNLSLTFDVDIQVGVGNVLLKKVSDDSLIESIDVTGGNFSISGKTATINPSADLPHKTEIYVTLPLGSVRDLSANSWTGLVNKTDWTFTTLNNAPTFTSTAVTSVNEGDTYTYTIATNDIDGDNVTVTATTKPSWLSLSSSTVVSTFAGSTRGYANGTGTAAQFDSPYDIVLDASGNIYVADVNYHNIRKINSSGVVTILAGSTGAIHGFTDATGTAAKFESPNGVAVDASGNVYVADANNHRIRKITPAGVVTTFAGSTSGFADATGTLAQFSSPRGVAVDISGNVYVADSNNQRIRKISPTGVVTTLAGSETFGSADGTGTSAQFKSPASVTVDDSGNVYVADAGNHKIRKITPAGVVTTLAGSTQGFADGTGNAAQFNQPFDVDVDGSGNVYVADLSNHKIRKISPTGVVTTLAGSTQGFTEGTGTAAQFTYPSGLAVDASGNVYVADWENHKIRKITQNLALTGDSTGNAGVHNVTLTANDSNGGTTNQVFTVTVKTTPTVTSAAATTILANGATLNGNVTADGFNTITERGFVYSLSSDDTDPNIGDTNVTKVIATGTTGAYNKVVSGLAVGLDYSFKAYATNSVGTSYGAVETFNTDNIPPTLTITSPVANPTNVAFTATFTFSEFVTGFDIGDITVGNGTASDFKNISIQKSNNGGSPFKYSALITPTTDGLVTVDVAADVAADQASNNNTAATQFSTTYDITKPTIVISSTVNDPTNAAFTATFTFSEFVTGFDITDITLSNATASDFTNISVTKSTINGGNKFTALITPIIDGLVTIDVAADVAADQATNTNTAAMQFSVTYDITAPTVVISSPVADPTNAAFTTTFTFSEDVTGFDITDITLGNATASGFTSSSSAVYTALIMPTTDGTVTVDLAADVANDAATNGNTVATQFSVLYDATPPDAPINVDIDTYTCPGDTTTTADTTLVINGTAEANAIIEVYVNTTSIGTTSANGTGAWSFDYTGTTLADGSYSITATATDSATNTSALSVGFNIMIDTVDTDSDGNPDFCDDDDDNDGVLDVDDNSYLPNPDQADSNNNGIGDVQEDCDNDGVLNYYDTDNSACQEGIVMKKKYGFSPNGDGINDTWVIRNILLFPNNVVNIYNRSGKPVFTMKGYDNSFNGFSNKTNSSNKLPVGAYYFTVEFNTPGAKPAKGWIYINY